jgi:CDP-glucose 4,6-dehydratase
VGQWKSALENVVMDLPLKSFYQGKTVLITGHTGFKGGWLATWLKLLGAEVIGFSLPPEKNGLNLFEAAHIGQDMASVMGDVRDVPSLSAVFKEHSPQVVFHLAAQSLVRRSYANPFETYGTNVMGTVNVLEAVRHTPSVRVVVIITSDKCYENREWVYAYRENDAMGGYDPYSASKGSAELVVASYRNSFFNPNHFDKHGVSLASVRAGNVIGGGDWAEDRLIPDCIRALVRKKPVPIRNPHAIRPWQFVLEPLAGYLWLAVRLWQEPSRYIGAWNFGPSIEGNASVKWIVEHVIKNWKSGEWEDVSASNITEPHEATFLRLDCTKAANLLEWTPVLSLSKSIRETVKWYRHHHFDKDFDARVLMVQQIKAYVAAANRLGLRWAISDLKSARPKHQKNNCSESNSSFQ